MPAQLLSPHLLPILLLIGSNIFMTLAWYGHLRFKEVPLVIVIVAAWAIAFFKYCMAVPANRWGSAVYTTAQLQDHSGGDHAPGLRRIFDPLPQRADHLELCDRLRTGRRRRFFSSFAARSKICNEPDRHNQTETLPAISFGRMHGPLPAPRMAAVRTCPLKSPMLVGRAAR